MDSSILEEELFRIEQNPKYIQELENASPELIEQAMCTDSSVFQYLRADQLNERLCTLAILIAADNLAHVPDQYRTEKLCFRAIDTNFKNLKFLKAEQITLSLLKRLVKSRPKIIQKLPRQYVTVELEQIALESIQEPVRKK